MNDVQSDADGISQRVKWLRQSTLLLTDRCLQI